MIRATRNRIGAGLCAAAVGVTITAFLGSAPGASCPWVGSTASVEDRVAQVLGAMSLSDEVAMVHGITEPQQYVGFPGGPPYAGVIAANPTLCIPELRLEDGPAGVGDGMKGVTQLPAPVAAAASWDPELMRTYGVTIGAEQRGKGVSVALAPTINMVRDPRWGRAFESLGEDPYLTGRLAVADIEGIQSQGVMAQVKHYAVYNQEFLRDTLLDDAIVADRVMHEIYLPGFEASVREAGVASVMCSYNEVNTEPACGHPYLLTSVLKGEFGFTGFVTSDWFATTSSARAALAGLDMQMPDHCYFGERLGANVKAGTVPKARLDDMVRRILREMFRFGMFDTPSTGTPGAVVTNAAHAAFARSVAENGTVLLKNAGGALPLDAAGIRSIAVIGRGAGPKAQSAGGGSATVVAPYLVTPFRAIARRAGPGVHVAFDNGNDPLTAIAAARAADVAIVFATLPETESGDLKTFDLPLIQNLLIELVAHANPNTIVVLNTGSAVTMPWLADVAGVLEAWYPGQEDGNAIAAVLFGDVDPAGRLPVTFPKDLTQVPANDPTRWPGVVVTRYAEGLEVGYRWYDAHNLTPLFPFGFGLSYTTFSLHGLQVTPSQTGTGAVSVSVEVTNTGARAGSEVVQVYLADPPAAGEPPRQLKGFQKVSLAPGQTQTVTLALDARALSFWDPAQRRWVAPAGAYTIFAGTSSRDLPLRTAFGLTGTLLTSAPAPTPPAPAALPTTADVADGVACPSDVIPPLVAGGLTILGRLP